VFALLTNIWQHMFQTCSTCSAVSDIQSCSNRGVYLTVYWRVFSTVQNINHQKLHHNLSTVNYLRLLKAIFRALCTSLYIISKD